MQDTLWLLLCLKIVLDYNSYISLESSETFFMKNILKKSTCKWACIISSKQLQQLFIQITHISLKRSHKVPVKKDLMRTILFKINHPLKLDIILCILHVQIIFMIDQTIYSFPNKCRSLPIKFCKHFWFVSDDNNVSNVIFGMYFDL